MNAPRIFLPVVFALILHSCESNHLLKEVKKIDYPSASAIEYYDRKLYVMGDDANYLVVMDSSFNIMDSIPFFHYPEKRIDKNIKPDIEAMTTIYASKESIILLLGSGSVTPFRNSGYRFHPGSSAVDSVRLDGFYENLHSMGLKEVNIEGLCATPQGLILANRGNLGYPSNVLIFTNLAVLSGRTEGPVSVVKLGGNNDTSQFRGVSGLAYSRKSDMLILTVSTEATTNAFEDGAIGKSYLWVVNNLMSKRSWKAINPDKIIDLEEVDARFKGQKIESACIMKETGDFLHLVLAADNDDGSSTLLRMVMEK